MRHWRIHTLPDTARCTSFPSEGCKNAINLIFFHIRVFYQYQTWVFFPYQNFCKLWTFSLLFCVLLSWPTSSMSTVVESLPYNASISVIIMGMNKFLAYWFLFGTFPSFLNRTSALRHFLILCAVDLACLKHSVLYMYLVKNACHLFFLLFVFLSYGETKMQKGSRGKDFKLSLHLEFQKSIVYSSQESHQILFTAQLQERETGFFWSNSC